MGRSNTGKNVKSASEGITTFVQTIISVSVNVLVVAVLVMLILNYSGKAYEFGKAIFTDVAVSDAEHAKNIVVTVPKGADNRKVAQLLEKADLVEDSNVFWVQILLSDYKNDIQAGTYTLSTGDKPSKLIEKLAKPENLGPGGEQAETQAQTEEAKP